MNKSIIACSIIKNKQFVNAIEKGNINYLTENSANLHSINFNNRSALYYAIYYKQYDVIVWLLNNNIPIEFIDLEFTDETSRDMLFNAAQCPSRIKIFLEKDIYNESRKRKNDTDDDFHSKMKCI
jgi:putative heme iron utilization protein